MRAFEELLKREDARMEGWVQSLNTLRFKVVGSCAVGEHLDSALGSMLYRFSEEAEKLRHRYFEEYSNLLVGEINDADSLKKVFMNFIREFGTNSAVFGTPGRDPKPNSQSQSRIEIGLSAVVGNEATFMAQNTTRDACKNQTQPAYDKLSEENWTLGKRKTSQPSQLDGTSNLQGFNKFGTLPCIDFECVFFENDTKEPAASTGEQNFCNAHNPTTTTGLAEASISDINLLSSIKDELDDLFDINCTKISKEAVDTIGFGSKISNSDSTALEIPNRNGIDLSNNNKKNGAQATHKVQTLNSRSLQAPFRQSLDLREQLCSPGCKAEPTSTESGDNSSCKNYEIICLKVHSNQPYQVDVCSRLVRRIRLAQNDPDDLRHRKLLFKTPVIIPYPPGFFRLVYPSENYFLEYKSGSSSLKKFQNCGATSSKSTASQTSTAKFFQFSQSLFAAMFRETAPEAPKPMIKTRNEEIFVLVNNELYSAIGQEPDSLYLCRKLSGENLIDFDVVKNKDGSRTVVTLSNSQEKIYIESTTVLQQTPVVKDLICTYKLGDTGKFHIKFHRVVFVRHDTVFVVASRRDKKLDDQYLDILVYTILDSKTRHRGTYPSNKVTGLVPLSIDLCCIFPASTSSKEKYLSCIDLYNNLMIYFKFNTEKLLVACHDKAHHRIFKGSRC